MYLGFARNEIARGPAWASDADRIDDRAPDHRAARSRSAPPARLRLRSWRAAPVRPLYLYLDRDQGFAGGFAGAGAPAGAAAGFGARDCSAWRTCGVMSTVGVA